jgi:hypothetical protein
MAALAMAALLSESQRRRPDLRNLKLKGRGAKRRANEAELNVNG